MSRNNILGSFNRVVRLERGCVLIECVCCMPTTCLMADNMQFRMKSWVLIVRVDCMPTTCLVQMASTVRRKAACLLSKWIACQRPALWPMRCKLKGKA